ncbi:MAG: winged helix-turn-helix domain-containing protein [Thermoproteota archaeon]|nr:winged helix-turn-helix domain-containing protein [Thermoproteota archaeon]
MVYRDRVDIIKLILEAANGGGVTKTIIMYKTFLSHEHLQEYLVLLTENDLLRYDKVMRTFQTNEKGVAFLQAYNEIGQILKEGQPVYLQNDSE